MGKKMYTKRPDARSDAPTQVNVMKILADPYPIEGEDYAIHLWYKAHGHNPRFSVTEKSFDRSDNETAILVVNGDRWKINIRKCTFLKI